MTLVSHRYAKTRPRQKRRPPVPGTTLPSWEVFQYFAPRYQEHFVIKNTLYILLHPRLQRRKQSECSVGKCCQIRSSSSITDHTAEAETTLGAGFGLLHCIPKCVKKECIKWSLVCSLLSSFNTVYFFCAAHFIERQMFAGIDWRLFTCEK